MSNATRPRPSTPPSESPFLEELTVFERGTGGYDTYRIPAMVVAPNGDLLAFAEGRVDGPDDHGNIDVVMKRSSDKGRTWSELSVVTDNGAHVAGNPGPVVDLMDPEHPEGRILMLFNTSSEPEDEIMAGRGVREVWVTESADNGATWSVPRNITLDVHRPLQSSVDTRYAFEEDWRWYAVTPGHAIQLVHGPARGRLFIPANHSTPEGLYASHAFWSDDHGISWHLGASVGEGTNEVQAVELANGDIMMNMRNHRGGRPLMRAGCAGACRGPVIHQPSARR